MRIKVCLFVFILLIKSIFLFSQVAINADGSKANNSAMLDVKSNNKGFLPPRMTQAEMMAIPIPANGLIVYCTDCLQDGNGVLATFMNGCWNALNVYCFVPISPVMATNVPSDAGIVWDWKGVPYATGYKWSLTNDYRTSTQMDTVTTKTEIGLACNTAYTRYVWAYNTCGNSLPLTLSQTTLTCLVPTLSTIDASAITSKTAISGGNITNEGGSPVTVRGVCWATVANPTTANSKTSNGTGIGTFASNLTGHAGNTTYYVKAYATNSAGTAYGNETTFETLIPILFNPDLTYGTMTDNDGNVYKTITIGTQTWMAENLKTTKYRNGDAIPNVKVNASWAGLVTGAYCWYNNDASTYKAAYGALYNWNTVADTRNIAPAGWHVPTEAEFTTLTDYLGGWEVAGGKLKETDTFHWYSPNTGASNSSGFTALPGGFRHFNNGFFGFGFNGWYWSSSAADTAMDAWMSQLTNDDAHFFPSFFGKTFGIPVRCVKD